MEVGQESQGWCRFRGTLWILVVARDSADSPREGLGATVLSFDFDRSRLHERRNSCVPTFRATVPGALKRNRRAIAAI